MFSPSFRGRSDECKSSVHLIKIGHKWLFLTAKARELQRSGIFQTLSYKLGIGKEVMYHNAASLYVYMYTYIVLLRAVSGYRLSEDNQNADFRITEVLCARVGAS